MLTLSRSHLGRARLEDPDPFAGLPQGPYKAPPIEAIPGHQRNTWERAARPWEHARRRDPAWWFEQAETWARAAVDALPEAADRFGGYAVACRRRGEVEQMIRDRRTPATAARRPTTGRIVGALARGELYLWAGAWPDPELDPMWEAYAAAAVPWVEGEDLARLAERTSIPRWAW